MFFIKKLDVYITCWIWALYPDIWVRCLKIKHSFICVQKFPLPCVASEQLLLCSAFFFLGFCDSHQPSYLQSLVQGNWKLQLLEHYLLLEDYLLLPVRFVFHCDIAKEMFVQLRRHLSRDKQKCQVLVEWAADIELILDWLTRTGDT